MKSTHDQKSRSGRGEGSERQPPEQFRILFVDDEPAILDGLRRALHNTASPVRELQFAGSPAEALRKFQEKNYHVVVSDMHMPGMTGAELLRRIAALAPDCIRIMLTGQADLETAMAAVNQGHVFRLLCKPCGRSELFSVLDQASQQYMLQTSERRLLQLQLEHAQKLSAVGQLAAGIVHDVNNILSCIAVLSDETLAETRPQARQRIHDAAMQAATLTRELMRYCRRDEEQPSPQVDLAEIVKGSADMVTPLLEQRITLHTDLPPGLPLIRGHASKIKQIIINLTLNARDAIPQEGEIHVTASECTVTEVEAFTRPGSQTGHFVCLAVRDTGCGMDEETRRRIFEPFFTTKASGQGTGLGLSIVRQLVGQLQGWITLESKHGQGTIFRIFLPTVPGVSSTVN